MRNRCKPVQVGTKERGTVMKRIQIVEDGRVLAKEAKNWRIEGQKRKIIGKEYRRLSNEFELEGLMARKGLWNLASEKRLLDRGALPREEGDVIREYNAMHEQNFSSSWLREDLVGKEERRKEEEKEIREEKRGEEEKRNEMVIAERWCVNSVSTQTFDIYS